MRERLEQRLGELRGELERGQRMLQEIEARRTEMRDSLLRLSGAIRVLEEELQRPAE
jgi:hypothetical protein